MTDAYVIQVIADIDTEVGTIAPGTRFLAVPDATRDAWTIELSLPRNGIGSRQLTVPATSVQHGSELPDALQRRMAAWEDYRFARGVLHLDRAASVEWLCRGYKVTRRSLERWGFSQHQLGASA